MRARHGPHSEMRSKMWHNAAGLAERGAEGGAVYQPRAKRALRMHICAGVCGKFVPALLK